MLLNSSLTDFNREKKGNLSSIMEKAHVFHNGKRVWSVGSIQNNTFFGPYKGDVKKMIERILTQDHSLNFKDTEEAMKISLESDEQIWLPVVPGALCKWDPTMEMIRGPDSEIYLRTTREIMPREELRAWFSPSLERELGISKHEINSKGIGHQCQTCNMINQRSTLSTHALYTRNCDVKVEHHQRELRSTFLLPSQGSLDLKKSPTQGFLSVHNHELNSAFKRYSHKKFSQTENPKLASLISTFSSPRELKDASSESLADFHKKEFRKKFQGNEHYLRKHLYREGLDKCSLAQLSEHAQNYFTTMSITRPAVKYEKFQSSCYENNHVNIRLFRQFDEDFKDEKSMPSETGKHTIWNPFYSQTDGVEAKPELHSKENQNKDFVDSERLDFSSEENGNKYKHEITKVDSEHNNESQRNFEDLEVTKGSCQRDEKFNEETKMDESTAQTMEEKTNRIDQSTHTKAKDIEKRNGTINTNGTSSNQSAFISRDHYSTLRTWLYPPSSMLSSLAMKEMTPRAASLASISRYQNLHPLVLPYGMPSSNQSRTRVTQGFTCDFCGKVYCRKYVLKIHMRTHTGFKPLRCKFCDKSFSDPSNMKKHVKLHETENTVHKCEHCGRNFVRYRGLLNHIKSKHTEPMNMGVMI